MEQKNIYFYTFDIMLTGREKSFNQNLKRARCQMHFRIQNERDGKCAISSIERGKKICCFAYNIFFAFSIRMRRVR